MADLTDDDRAALTAIATEPDDRQRVRLIYVFWGDLDRSDRVPRSTAYLHLGMLAGMCERLLAHREAVRASELRAALDELIKLQAHYAELLNMHDGGQRHAFASADEWIARLREINPFMNEKDEIDTFNRYMVGVRGDRIVITLWRVELSKAEALTLAAWLVALAEDQDHEFAPVLQAVQNT